MKKSQLIDILGSLDKSEVREFRKWLLSPVHNQREDVVQLYDYLLSGNHLQEDKFLEKERIYRKLFGKEAYNDAKLRQTNHFLNRCLEEYLSYKEWKEDEIRSRVPLMPQLRKRKLSKVFKRSLKSLESAQQEQPFRNDQYLRNEYLIQLQHFNYLQERERSPQNNLQEVCTTLDQAYFSEKLMLACRMLFHQNVYKTDFDFGPILEIVKFIEARSAFDNPAISIYYYIYKALMAQDGQLYFEKLRNVLFGKKDIFPDTQLKEIYLMAINYCIGKMNAGVEQFVRESFEWYRQGFADGILIENQTISRWTYLNAVINALRLHEFDWAENFIEKYKHLIEPAHRENFSQFSKAKLLFEQKKYDQAMDYLIHVEYDDILMNLNAKSMLLKIYYGQNEIDVLESLLDSMSNYMRRKKVIGYHRSIYSNLIRFTKKILKVNPYNKEKFVILRNEIESANPLPERQWLLEQLDKL